MAISKEAKREYDRRRYEANKVDPEWRAKRYAQQAVYQRRKYETDPVWRLRRLEGQKLHRRSPEYRAHRSEYDRDYWAHLAADPERRAKRNARQRQQPAYAAKHQTREAFLAMLAARPKPIRTVRIRVPKVRIPRIRVPKVRPLTVRPIVVRPRVQQGPIWIPVPVSEWHPSLGRGSWADL